MDGFPGSIWLMEHMLVNWTLRRLQRIFTSNKEAAKQLGTSTLCISDTPCIHGSGYVNSPVHVDTAPSSPFDGPGPEIANKPWGIRFRVCPSTPVGQEHHYVEMERPATHPQALSSSTVAGGYTQESSKIHQ